MGSDQRNALHLRLSLTTHSKYSICSRASYWTGACGGGSQQPVETQSWFWKQRRKPEPFDFYLVWERCVDLLLQTFHDLRVSGQIVGQQAESNGAGLQTSIHEHYTLRTNLMIIETCHTRMEKKGLTGFIHFCVCVTNVMWLSDYPCSACLFWIHWLSESRSYAEACLVDSENR